MNFALPDLLELLRERHEQLMREKDERHVRKSN
jgi:hypothetical protein